MRVHRACVLSFRIAAACCLSALPVSGAGGPEIPGDQSVIDSVVEKLEQRAEIAKFDLSGRDKANFNFTLLSGVILDLAKEIAELKSSVPREIHFKQCKVFVTDATAGRMNYHRGDGAMAGERCPQDGWVVVGVGDAKHKGELRMQNLYCCELGLWNSDIAD